MTDGSRDRERGGWEVVRGERKARRFPRDAPLPRFHEAADVYPRRANKPRFPLETFESRKLDGVGDGGVEEARGTASGRPRENAAYPKLWKEEPSCAVALDLLVAACRFS